MKRRKKMDHCEAKWVLGAKGIDFHKDFFVLPPSDVSLIQEIEMSGASSWSLVWHRSPEMKQNAGPSA
jgi:hypothetical protein